MQINQELIVNIEKLSNLGLGIAKHEGLVIFVGNACPGDELKIKITKINKNYATAKIEEIISPSPHRVKPFCAMQNVCGACQLQFIDYNYQLLLKKQIVEDAMRTIGNLDIEIPQPIPSPQIKEYRHKIQYPVSQTKVSKRLVAGYYKPATHEIVNIKHCPIQPKICDEIVEFIKAKATDYNISGYNEKTHSGDLRHIVMRISADNNKCLLTFVLNSTKASEKLTSFAKCVYDKFEDVIGVCVNFNINHNNVILGKQSQCLCGQDFIEEKILDKTFKIGPNTFFQINPKSAENIFSYVREYIKNNFNNPVVLDAYAGVTSFGICVSDVCKTVVSVEENPESVKLAAEIIKNNRIDNIEIHNQDATEFFSEEMRKFDAIILDPPRKGCTKESLDEAVKLCSNKIIYVSCNPATLARDLKYLKEEKGCRIESIQPFDMFCHTYHIENVAIISI